MQTEPLLFNLTRVLVFTLVSCSVFLAGCNNPLVKSEESQAPLPPARTDELERSEVELHESDLLGDPLYVILGIDVVNRDQLKLKDELLESVYNILSNNWVRVDLRGRNSNTPFKEEIERSLRKTTDGAYLGAQKVNYILAGKLEISTFKQKYSGPSLLCKTLRSKCSGSCEYEAKVVLSLEAESLPQKRRSKKWVLTTSASQSFDANRQCPNPRSPGEHGELYKEMIEEVVDDIVRCSRDSLEDYFASRGFILQYFSDGKQFLFEISGGAAAGFSEGDTVIIDRVRSALGGEMVDVIAEGEVVRVGEKRSRISVKNQAIANRIKVHDRVRVQKSRYIPNVACRFVLEEK
jgi:hypothetical protein